MIRLALILIVVSATPALAAPPNGNVRAISPTAYEFDREEVLTQIAAQRMGCQWVVPNYEGERYAGFRIVGVARSAALLAMGLEQGDIVKAVSGVPITSPNQSLALHDALANDGNVSVTVMRAGKLITYEYRAN